jgi:tetratricopeptide (TPR) repeat protein
MQARALDWLGWARTGQGHHQDALQLCQQALEIQHELGDAIGAASTWDTLGHVHHLLEHYDQATTCYRQALAGYQELGDPFHPQRLACSMRIARSARGGSPSNPADPWR